MPTHIQLEFGIKLEIRRHRYLTVIPDDFDIFKLHQFCHTRELNKTFRGVELVQGLLRLGPGVDDGETQSCVRNSQQFLTIHWIKGCNLSAAAYIVRSVTFLAMNPISVSNAVGL